MPLLLHNTREGRHKKKYCCSHALRTLTPHFQSLVFSGHLKNNSFFYTFPNKVRGLGEDGGSLYSIMNNTCTYIQQIYSMHVYCIMHL